MSVLLQMPTNILRITILKGVAGDHKGPPGPASPPSPLQEGEGKFLWKDGESILPIR